MQKDTLQPCTLVTIGPAPKPFTSNPSTLPQNTPTRPIPTNRMPDFLPETAAIRAAPSWKCAPPAPGLVDRRVEITGPVDRKMVINAMNSGATQFMADFEGEQSAAIGACCRPLHMHRSNGAVPWALHCGTCVGSNPQPPVPPALYDVLPPRPM